MFRFVKLNKVKCLHCGDILISQSETPSEVMVCSCGRIKMSGGATSMLRSGIQNTDYKEMSQLNFDRECNAVKEDVQDPPPEQEKMLSHLKNKPRR